MSVPSGSWPSRDQSPLKASVCASAVFVDVFCPLVPACFISSEESKNLSLRALLANREKSVISPRDDDLDPDFELPVDRCPVEVVLLFRDNSILKEVYGGIFAKVHVRGEIGVVAGGESTPLAHTTDLALRCISS